MNPSVRLKEERTRLGMSQTRFASIAGVGKTTQINYESGSRAPDMDYLAAVARFGVDVQYVITGIRSAASLTPEETVLLEGYRGLDAETRKRMLAFMLGGAAPAKSTTKSTAKATATVPSSPVIHGPVGAQHVTGGSHTFKVKAATPKQPVKKKQ